jgi:hypothetical protein
MCVEVTHREEQSRNSVIEIPQQSADEKIMNDAKHRR